MKTFIVALLVISAVAADVAKKHEKRGLASYGPPAVPSYAGGFSHGGFAGVAPVKTGGFGGYVYGPPAVNRVPVHVEQPTPFALPHPGPALEFRRPVISHVQPSAPVFLSQRYGVPVHRAPLPAVFPSVHTHQSYAVPHSVPFQPVPQTTFHVSQPVPATQVAEHHSVQVAQPLPVTHSYSQSLPVAHSYPQHFPVAHSFPQSFPVSHPVHVPEPLPIAQSYPEPLPVEHHHSVPLSLPVHQTFNVAPVHHQHSAPVHVAHHEVAQPALPAPSFSVPSSSYGTPIVSNTVSSGPEVSISSLPSNSYGPPPSTVVHTSAPVEVNEGYSYPVPTKKLLV
ncbi:tyrosine-protein phosphatase non-receptor type 23-like [Prorops nasuta]|uniref:tyrosine-protein phosphatase non-receptor type 23-like n=1 Tax=Prorops nasuta TaxID=863751 RepID=UPI0034CE41FD